mgnify:CR=1 FL=1
MLSDLIRKYRQRLLKAKSIEYIHIFEYKNEPRITIVYKPNIYTKSVGIIFRSLDSLKRFVSEVIMDDLNILKGVDGNVALS